MIIVKAYLYWILAAAMVLQTVWADNNLGKSHKDAITPLQKVRVQLKWAHQFQFSGYYAAIENGYYRDVGLDVALIEYSPALTPIDQLIGGRVDFAVADSGALIYRSTGVPLIALAAIFQNSPSILISRADTGITQLEDLKGKKIMLAGGHMNAELMSMLRRVGIASDDFELIPAETQLQALIDGDIHAYNGYTTNEPLLLKKKNIPFIEFAPMNYGVDFYGDILITNESTLVQSPEMVRNFVDATLKGWIYALENPDIVVDIIVAKYNTQNKSKEHLLFEAKEAKKLIMPNIIPVGYMNKERWKRIEAVFMEQGIISQHISMRDFLYTPDNDITLEEALKKYSALIVVGVASIAGLFMIFHMLRLKAQVSLSTRELKVEKLRAEKEARTDMLTGLPNRRYFFEQLDRDIAYAERNNISLSLILFDIDFFKDINDRYGHSAGDEALRNVGCLFNKYTRSGEIAARIGGEEFALACLNADIEEAYKLGERLRNEIEAMPLKFQGQSFSLTLSAGVATLEDGDDRDQLIQNADRALYSAKQCGRNRVCIFSPSEDTDRIFPEHQFTTKLIT